MTTVGGSAVGGVVPTQDAPVGTGKRLELKARSNLSRRRRAALMAQFSRKGRCTHCRGTTCVFSLQREPTWRPVETAVAAVESQPTGDVNSTLVDVTAGETASGSAIGSAHRENGLNPNARPFVPRTRGSPLSQNAHRRRKAFLRWMKGTKSHLRILERQVLVEALEDPRNGLSVKHLLESYDYNVAEFIEYELWNRFTSQRGIFRDTVVGEASRLFVRGLSPVQKGANFSSAIRYDVDLRERLTGLQGYDEFVLFANGMLEVRKDRKPPALRILAEEVIRAHSLPVEPGLSYTDEISGKAFEGGPEEEWVSDDDDTDPFYDDPYQYNDRYSFGGPRFDREYRGWSYR